MAAEQLTIGDLANVETISQCGLGTTAECRIIEALSPSQTVAHSV